MATPGEKLSESLEKLKSIQDRGIVAIKSSDLSRVHKERLIKNGFIKEVVKGWYISTPHDEYKGDSTSWFTSFWEFCSRYLIDRFGDEYCISAEQSMMLHAGNNSIPQQLIVRSPIGNNSITKLLFGTSIFVMKSPLTDFAETEKYKGIKIVSLASSLIHSTPSVFTKQVIDSRTALMMIKDSSELLGILLDGGHSTIAGRLIGAYRNIGQNKIADEIEKTMATAGYDIREVDPFREPSPIILNGREQSPYVTRIRLMWEEMRGKIMEIFPKAPGIPKDKKSYMEKIDEIYSTDAYHSLSIEKYKVSLDLIEKVKSGKWNPNDNDEDAKQKDAMAARGYWQAFNAVKNSINQIFEGSNPGKVLNIDHGDWYRELFGPSVVSGILKPSDLAGYRNAQVYIGQSMHTPMNVEGVRDAMPLLFELLEGEDEPGVRAVLGHFIFVYIHPYMDGNGRIARFLMNSMLISGGYPWTVIPVEKRDAYMSALEKASVENDIVPFAKFIAYLVDASLKGKPVAKMID